MHTSGESGPKYYGLSPIPESSEEEPYGTAVESEAVTRHFTQQLDKTMAEFLNLHGRQLHHTRKLYVGESDVAICASARSSQEPPGTLLELRAANIVSAFAQKAPNMSCLTYLADTQLPAVLMAPKDLNHSSRNKTLHSLLLGAMQLFDPAEPHRTELFLQNLRRNLGNYTQGAKTNLTPDSFAASTTKMLRSLLKEPSRASTVRVASSVSDLPGWNIHASAFCMTAALAAKNSFYKGSFLNDAISSNRMFEDSDFALGMHHALALHDVRGSLIDGLIGDSDGLARSVEQCIGHYMFRVIKTYMDDAQRTTPNYLRLTALETKSQTLSLSQIINFAKAARLAALAMRPGEKIQTPTQYAEELDDITHIGYAFHRLLMETRHTPNDSLEGAALYIQQERQDALHTGIIVLLNEHLEQLPPAPGKQTY